MKKLNSIFTGIISVLSLILVTSCKNSENTNQTNSEHVHQYSEAWTIDVEPTCTRFGIKSHHCKGCNDRTDFTEIPITGHTFGEWIITKESTEMTTGTKERECSVCHTKETETIPLLSHTHNYSDEWTVDVEPTCTETGSKSHHCLECEAKKDVSDIPALGHSFGEWTITKEATDDTTGTKESNCSVCNHKEVKSFKATEGLRYSLKTDTNDYSVVGNGTGINGDIIIPSSLSSLPVTSIGDSAFFGCDSLTSVFIPNSVKSIGEYAFYNCSRLTSIIIPDSVTSIGDGAFYYCSSLTNVYYEGTIEDWCNITRNSSDSNPMFYASHFYIRNSNNEWEEVTSIEIPNTITEIGAYQFDGFNNVTSITIPNSVKSIGDYAFSGCSSLTSITIPNSVKSIGKYAFYNCSSLTSITLPFVGASLNGTSNTYFGYIFGASTSGDNSNYVPNSLKKVIITGGTSIGRGTFSGCSSLESVTIPNSVTSIGDGAFYYCSSLTNVYYEGTIEDWCNITRNSSDSNPMFYASHFYIRNSNNEWEEVTSIEIPNTITEIGAYQFDGFNNVTSITIPNSVKSIGDYAFSGCSSLTSITIPNSVKSIGDYAFEDCSSLTNVYYEGTIEDWSNIQFTNGYSNPMLYAQHFYLEKNNKGWEEVTSIEIPSTITRIGAFQFYGFRNVTSITIATSVISVGKSAFCECSSLTSITIPDSVTSIGQYAFYNCSSLTGITIPNSITSIGADAFDGCSNIEKAIIPTIAIPSIPKSKLKEVVITGGTSIGRGTFSGCSSLESVTIPNSVTSIGSSAFYYCSSLTNVYYEGTIEDWCNITLNSSDSNPMFYASHFYTSHFYIRNSNNEWEEVTSIEIPNTITEIGAYQFDGFNNVTSITIPNSVKSIGDYAFSGCSSLTSITIPNSVKSIGKYAFYNCSSLTSITLPFVGASLNALFGYIFGASEYIENSDYVPSSLKEAIITGGTSIWSYAFYGCSSLTSITIPNSVKSIGDYAFSGCSSLTSITIPDSVTSIGYEAFYNCSSLASVTIPNSVKSIGNYAFFECKGIQEVYYNGTSTEWSNMTIGLENSALTSATRYYYSETQPTTSGYYWHFVDGVPTKW